MDLVASYGSDSENEAMKSSNSRRPSKVIDVIQLDDSDTEQPKATCSKKVDCIEIDVSDSEDIQIIEDNVCTKSDHKIEVKNESAKSTQYSDYLNLNDDEEEKPIPQAHINVNDLLSSATVLSNSTCGPVKVVSRCEQQLSDILPELRTVSRSSISRSSFSSATFDRTASTPDSGHTSRSSPYDRENETRKRLKINEGETNTVEEPHVFERCIYQEDARITEGYLKHVNCRIPRQLVQTRFGHSSIVTALNWCIPRYSHLLLSASADCTLKIWDTYHSKLARCFKNNSALKAAKWSLDGKQVLTGGYGKKACVYDVIEETSIVSYDVFNYVTSIEVHPYMDDVFLCGTHNAILGFDLRVNSSLPIRTFLAKCEEVLDLAFLDENEFICSTSIVSHDSADRTIMAWDFGSGAILSNQIFLELYTCPVLKVHPNDSTFVAQTNGDYIASFSTRRPYKIRNKRYMGHKVSGYGIECDISPDGKYLASGDASGDMYFYNYFTTNFIHKMNVKPNKPVNRLKWHTALPTTIATATLDGQIQIWN